ncbi:NUDIX hydrolase [Gordonia westfalica]|uniref:NUDIX hydrolase n=1 Tax=Gordonia westfalica TaxID=158898 RepID=UPI000944EF00|nr:NUDIX hydrolase [Gordonia westfalica]
MSTDSSTNPSDVSDVSSGSRGDGGGQAGQNPSGQGRRTRRGRRRRGRRKGDGRGAASVHNSGGHATAGHKQSGAKQNGQKPNGHKPGPHKQHNPATSPAPSTGRPTPNDLVRARTVDPACPDPVEAESVEKLPVDPDRARPKVTPPKPSDMATVTATITTKGLTQAGGKAGKGRRRASRADRAADRTGDRTNTDKLRTVRETSAGGLVISDLGLPVDELSAALIGRVDRRGRMMWSLPKGHIETGETAEQTAIREVEEETGIQGTVVAPLGKIDYWFVSEGRRIHKTVHHYLLRCVGGELSDADYEVSEVAWVPLHELPRRLTYSDERRLARMARGVIADLAADPTRLAQSEADSIRTEPNAYEKAAAARNQRRNEPPPPARPRRRRRRPRRPAAGDG